MAKILVSIDDNLLARIDKAARALGLSRSAYLARLAARDVEDRQGPGRRLGARRALSRLDEVFASNPSDDRDVTEAVRGERNAH